MVVDTNNYNKTNTDDSLCLDSDASHHMTPTTNAMMDVQPHVGTMSIIIEDGKILNVKYIGNFVLKLPNGSYLDLKKVFCVPLLRKNLISINKLTMDPNWQ